MRNKMIQNILANRFLAMIFLFPVLAAVILTFIGLYWGAHPFIFKNIGIHHFPNRASAPMEARYPWMENSKDRIVSYKQACVYALEDYHYRNIDTIQTVLPVFNDTNYTLDQFRDFISKNASPKDKKFYLEKIDFFKNFALIDKIINFIPWEIYTLLGILLIYLYVFHSWGRRILLIWWWCTLWAIPAILGFYAYFYGEHFDVSFYRRMEFFDLYNQRFSFLEFPKIQLFITLILIPGFIVLKYLINTGFEYVVPIIKKIRNANQF